ncbi:S-methyl-5-thioribose-1-phosphate isomerase [Methylocaldum marinum]|uniref:S-methyl-5-thioribose-1-phosphate isomerase n=1 Tax=Methylocaldum marinum TaxID=1432792 RepID=UPI000E69DB8C|nr:S-methyl-5-thioribose-1-phosphate isomerase [Methylocaldum marinum]
MSSSSESISFNDNVRALQWGEQGLRLLDQRRLPGAVEYETFDSALGVAEAIASMRVRGAPAIGIAAAYGVVLAARQRYRENPSTWREAIGLDLNALAGSRPTAVNLFWALERMRSETGKIEGDPEPHLLQVARSIHDDDISANRAMGEMGASQFAGASGVLTHCNTGSLATGGYGTALGVVRSAYRRGVSNIFATETRPWLQGARLTVWELEQDGIPATLIADSAAAYLMKTGVVQWIVVGADRIAANGDTANKIGTYALAVAARHHGVKFMVVAPTSTIDWTTESGESIRIEERDQSELLNPYFAKPGCVIKAWNPVFDVTPAELIDCIVTERGIVRNPDRQAMRALRADA